MSAHSPRQQEHHIFPPSPSEHLSEYLLEEQTTTISQTRPLLPSTERALPEPQARRSPHSPQRQQPEHQVLPESLPSETQSVSEQQRLRIGTIGFCKSRERVPSCPFLTQTRELISSTGHSLPKAATCIFPPQQTPMQQVQSPPFQSRERPLQLIQTSTSTASFSPKEGTGFAPRQTESVSEYRERFPPEQQTALRITPEEAPSAPQIPSS